MRVSLLLLVLALALVNGSSKSLADGFNPIVKSAWQEISELCGKAAQIARSLGMDTTGHEATMLIAAREDGADERDLSSLRNHYTIGEISAMREGYFDRPEEPEGTREFDAKLKETQKGIEEVLRTCTKSKVASIDQGRQSDHALKERKRVLAIQNALTVAGYDPGPADGVYGPKIRAAIEAYQRVYHLRVDGIASEKLLKHLRKRNSSQ